MTNFATPRYRLLGELGEGGMGIVYTAEDRLTGRQVAFKQVILDSDHDDVGELTHRSTSLSDEAVTLRLGLAREFQMLASLRHPYIVSVLDYGFTEAHQPFYVMELLADARTITEAAKSADEHTKITYLVQALQALAYLHQRGILHRDLKPENILVADGKARILDFGLSVNAADVVDTSGAVGSLLYMAPEVLDGKTPTISSDLYAMGVIAYEIFAGNHPFFTNATLDLIELIDIVVTQSVDLTSLNASPALVAVIDTLLRKFPSERYASASDALVALQAAVSFPITIETSTLRESYLQASRFVGRDSEIEQLTQALTEATEGHGSMWLVGGESGIGKSRLIDEFRSRALINGATVVVGQAVEHGSIPYQMWREAVALLSLTATLTDATLAALQWIHPDIGTLLGRHIPPTIDDQAREERLFDAVLTLFKQQQRPLLLILEDLHWAAGDLELLKRLMSMINNLKILIIGSYRNDELLVLPKELPTAHVMTLERLAEPSLATLVESMLGDTGTHEDLVHFLQRETEGNIFFLVEILRTLAEDAGSLAQVGQHALPANIFTGGIQKIVERRINKINQPDRDLLNLAAIIGRLVDSPILQATTPNQPIEQWAIRCADASILEIKDNQWRFAHDKLREGILKQLGDETRRSLHHRAAEAMTQIYGSEPSHAGQLAYHWAGAGDLEKEYTASIQASHYYLQLNLFRDAKRLAERALTLGEKQPDAQRAELASITNLAHAYWQLGEYEIVKPLIERGLASARALDDTPQFVDLSLILGRILRVQGEGEAGRQHLQWGLAAAKTMGDQRRVAQALLAHITPLLDADMKEARQIASEALDIYRQLGDELGEGYAISRLATTTAHDANIEESRRLVAHARDIFLKHNVRSGYVSILQHLVGIELSAGHLEEAKRLAEDGLQNAYDMGSKVLIANMLQILGQCNVYLHQWDEAERYEREAVAIFRSMREVSWLAFTLANLGDLLSIRGKYAEAQVELEEALAISRAANMPELVILALTNLSLVLNEVDDLEHAPIMLKEALTMAVEWGVIEDQLTVIDALVRYLVKRARFIESVEYSVFLLQQPTASKQMQETANTTLAQAVNALSAQQMTAAEQRGKLLTYAQIVSELDLKL